MRRGSQRGSEGSVGYTVASTTTWSSQCPRLLFPCSSTPLDYLYRKVLDAHIAPTSPERIAFAEHVKKVAAALKAIEWVDSCDWSKDRETEAIRACLPEGAALEAATKEAEKALAQLWEQIRLAKEAQ